VTDIDSLPLLGYTVAVTADRRRGELTSLLERRGARVFSAPTVQIVPLGEAELFAATSECLRRPVDVLVVSTAIGLRGWMDAVDGWGLGDRLRARLASCEVFVRGPKARGAARAAGLGDGWMPASETMAEVVAELLARGVAGQRIVVQLHGEPLHEEIAGLRAAGAEVVAVPVYEWRLPDDIALAQRLVELSVSRQVDAITFTSAFAVNGLLSIARRDGREDAFVDAMRGDVVPICVGTVCAERLEQLRVHPVTPGRARLGDLVRALVDTVPARRATTMRVAGHVLEMRGHVVVVDGSPVTIPPAPMAVLRSLAREPGRVLARDELARVLPSEQAGGHAVEMAITRLRSLLGDGRIVQTVVKRGYRLAG
jgi:uroporphyrinogen-III synthase